MEPALSSSKVTSENCLSAIQATLLTQSYTVEYFDPHNVYRLLSPGLLPRLPLRNLHWESHAGPLRSIQSLHVDFVPAAEARALSVGSASDLSRVRSSDTVSGDDGFRVQSLGAKIAEKDQPDSRSGARWAKGRRHQIPGLRQTPYLKVFFLRCDDNDTYKSSARKQIREWIKDHTPPAQSTIKVNAQENHDAYEWLIIHVIVPNTAAATQPRTSSKGSSTILEKLKADFNGSSKSSPDRVAQIRIGVNDVPYDLLPRVVPAIPGSYTETPKEHEESWHDLITKFKSLILASFDMRVTQYEEDIKEKDAQRSLPGWNFCTFFVLKEGLARGFESVGLVEDALVGYDELAIGLEAVATDQVGSTRPGTQSASGLLPFTPDLTRQFVLARAAILREEGVETESNGPIDLQNAAVSPTDNDEIPLSASRKNYRELILANDISRFDFRCYIFARQLSLLLRMGNAYSSREELLAKLKEQREAHLQGVAARSIPAQPADESEDLTILGEICRRALNFVTSISRLMREDLQVCAVQIQSEASSDSPESSKSTSTDFATTQAINNIVIAFTFSVTQQILAQTSTKSLPIPPSTLTPPIDAQGQEQKVSIPEPKTMMHPARSTSLTVRPSRDEQPPSPGIFPGRGSSVSDQGKTQSFLKTGLEELAARRAELYLLCRAVLEALGAERSWPVGWNGISSYVGDESQMEEISLSDENSQKQGPAKQPSPSVHGISSQLLRAALSTQDDFHRLYEMLTDKALRHFTVASHVQSLQAAMADLAVLKFYLRDYAAAASYFYRMTPFYGEGGWDQIEMSMLFMYTNCLRQLKRNDEYVRVALKLLAKLAAIEKDKRIQKRVSRAGLWQEYSMDGQLTDLMAIIAELPHEINVPLHNFFANAEIDGSIKFHDEQDSFALVLKIRYLLTDELTVDKARIRLVPTAGSHGREIWLESSAPQVIKKGTVRLQVQSNTIIPGTYTVKQITLHASKMVLTCEVDSTRDKGTFRSSRHLLYQRPQSVNLAISAARYLHLSRTRMLELTISSGWNDIKSGQLHVRAATAGLRLQTSELTFVSGDLKISKPPEAGVVKFGMFSKNEAVKIRVPFNVENEVPEIGLRLEMSYVTDSGTFVYATQPKMGITLPLGVNVQDVFKQKALFSKFSITTATGNPLRLLSSSLQDSEVFEATKGGDLLDPITIFQRQAATVAYRIARKETPSTLASNAAQDKKEKTTLSLVINYICLDEEIDQAVSRSLTRALEETRFAEFERLVIPVVIEKLNIHLALHDLERTALLNEIPTGGIADLHWQEHFSGLGQDNETGRETSWALADWLRGWQERNKHIPLQKIELDKETLSEARSIIIPVDVPPMTVVNTADLRLDHRFSAKAMASDGELIAVSGQPLSGKLKIKSTRLWDTRDSKNQDDSLEFVYELIASSDTWIVGGKRKGHFSVPPTKSETGHSLSFPVLLIPLKEGYLPYPSLDIRPAVVARPTERDGAKDEAAAITWENDYRNAGETLRVISNARKTTLSLDASGPQGGAWLLDSERRGEGVATFS